MFSPWWFYTYCRVTFSSSKRHVWGRIFADGKLRGGGRRFSRGAGRGPVVGAAGSGGAAHCAVQEEEERGAEIQEAEHQCQVREGVGLGWGQWGSGGGEGGMWGCGCWPWQLHNFQILSGTSDCWEPNFWATDWLCILYQQRGGVSAGKKSQLSRRVQHGTISYTISRNPTRNMKSWNPQIQTEINTRNKSFHIYIYWDLHIFKLHHNSLHSFASC